MKIFAGVHKSRNGKITPSGVGRICNWTPDLKAKTADEHTSFGAYQRSLTLKCEEGEPGIITWTPDKNTPNTVYYQCFTHRYLGWKINVLDSCDQQPQASKREEVIVDLEAEPSIRHETKLFPSDNFLKQHEKDLIKHHNMNGSPPKVPPELVNNSELNKLITEGIKTAEALEAQLIREQLEKQQKKNSTKLEEDDEEIAKLETAPEVQQAPRRPPLPPPHLIARPHFSSQQIPIYLRPPTGIPIYRPIKIAPRRPIAIERRPPLPPPPPSPFNHQPRPYLIPQQSIQINHYKKPLPPLGPPPMGLRNYVKGKMPTIPAIPPKQMHPVLLLGEPTEIKPFRKSSSDVVVGKPSKTQVDLAPVLKTKKITEQQLRQQPYKSNNLKPPKSPFKDPFNIRNESTTIIDAATDNKGFNADSIIVESGFRPIFRREDLIKRDEDEEEEEGIEEKVSFTIPSISRRSDNDFHDVIEGEGHFVQSDEPQSFEPMFIPSPQDVVALPLTNDTVEDDFMVAEASERQGIFYLPPNEVKRSAILDPLELKDPLPSQNDFVKLSSKTKKFIQNTPQFAPFLGELPRDFQQFTPSSSSPVIREKSSSPSVISTKLSAVSTNDDVRYKRDP